LETSSGEEGNERAEAYGEIESTPESNRREERVCLEADGREGAEDVAGGAASKYISKEASFITGN
jgi:hypothetical protein